jgi:hypothetical protein
MYLPKVLAATTRFERMKLWAFSAEMFALTVMQGRRLDADLRTLGIDHRELALSSFRNNDQVIRQMKEHFGFGKGDHVRGLYTLSRSQHTAIIDFLHPADDTELGEGHKRALAALDRAVVVAEKVFA